MTEQVAIDLARGALTVVVEVGGPFLVASLAVGMLVSIFQAVTQINEPTLTFVPKILVAAGIGVVLGPWMGQVVIGYAVGIFNALPRMAH